MQARQQHWQEVYRRKRAHEVTWYQPVPEPSLGLIRAVAKPTSRIVDVGGGASTLVDHLIDAGYHNLAVLDVSQTALDSARTRLGDRYEAVEWIVGDVTERTLAGPVDVWHDRAVLHFLVEKADCRLYRQNVEAATAPGSHVVLAAFAQDGPRRCSGLAVQRYDETSLAEFLGPKFRTEETKRHIHKTPSGVDQPFVYVRVRRIAR